MIFFALFSVGKTQRPSSVDGRRRANFLLSGGWTRQRYLVFYRKPTKKQLHNGRYHVCIGKLCNLFMGKHYYVLVLWLQGSQKISQM